MKDLNVSLFAKKNNKLSLIVMFALVATVSATAMTQAYAQSVD